MAKEAALGNSVDPRFGEGTGGVGLIRHKLKG